jgi:hypothetical protein
MVFLEELPKRKLFSAKLRKQKWQVYDINVVIFVKNI